MWNKTNGRWFIGEEKSGKIIPARVSPLAFPVSGPCLSFTSKMGTSNGAVLMGQGTVLCQVPSYSRHTVNIHATLSDVTAPLCRRVEESLSFIDVTSLEGCQSKTCSYVEKRRGGGISLYFSLCVCGVCVWVCGVCVITFVGMRVWICVWSPEVLTGNLSLSLPIY